MATDIIPATARAATLSSQPSGLPELAERAGGAMKRFRLSTLMLLIVIAALGMWPGGTAPAGRSPRG